MAAITDANILFKEGKYREALAIYEAIVEQTPFWRDILEPNILICREQSSR
jgi:hypothetical protein